MNSITRSKYHEYFEYHTSLDNLDFITGECLLESLGIYQQCVLAIEGNCLTTSLTIGEPQLGKRGLYPTTGGQIQQSEISDLLNITEVTSSDFNTVKALANGEINSFLGFNFIVSNRLSKSSTTRSCIAYAQDGIALGVGKDVNARIDERSDKSYATQVYYCMSIGATRMEEAKVVEVQCTEA